MLAVAGVHQTYLLRYHPLFFAWNPGLGFARLAVWIGFLSAAGTILTASASTILVAPFYIGFYLIMAYAVIKTCGQLDLIYRISYRVDVVERRNSTAGFYLGGRTLAVANVFSGSMIGEGPGFYVVLFFFGLGWLFLELTVYLGCAFRRWRLKKLIRESEGPAVSVIASWYIVVSLILRRACAGDFIGWIAGMRDFGIKAIPLLGVLGIAWAFGASDSADASKRSGASRIYEILTVLVYGIVYVWMDYLL